MDHAGYAPYFSRAPIPWDQDRFAQERDTVAPGPAHLRHIGLYAYTAGFLKRYVTWPASPLESIEALEQLRILWHGETLIVVTIAEPPEAGIDTEADLRRVEAVLGDSV